MTVGTVNGTNPKWDRTKVKGSIKNSDTFQAETVSSWSRPTGLNYAVNGKDRSETTDERE